MSHNGFPGLVFAIGYEHGRRYHKGHAPRPNNTKTKWALLFWFLGFGF